MDDYSIRGRDIFSPKGKLVAVLDDDGNPVMAPGMAGPHSRGVREFLADVQRSTFNVQRGEQGMPGAGSGQDGARGAGGADAGEPRSTADAGRSAAQDARGSALPVRDRAAAKRDASNAPQGTAAIEDIPESLLPPFSPELGTATPGFAEFVAKHQFTAPQVAALIRRLETK